MSTKEIREALEQMRINFLIEINRVIDKIGFVEQNKIKLPISKIISTDSEEFKKKYTEFLQDSSKNAPTEEEMPGVSVSIKGDTEMNFKNEIINRNKGLMEYRETIYGIKISVYGRTKTELWNKFMERKKDIKKRPAKKQQAKSITFYEWIDKWFNVYKSGKLAESTEKTLISYIKRIKSGIKNIQLNKLQPLTIQEFLNSIEQSRTRKAFHMHLNDCLGKAAKLNIIKYNVMNGVESVKHEYEKSVALTENEEAEFIKKLDNLENKELAIYFKFCLWTGCRRNEALTVKWSDIDFEKKTIHLHGTKTEKSDRLIPLSDRLADILTGVNKSNGYLFTILPDYATKSFKELCPKHHLHELRHTFATRCIEKGVAMKTLQLWLGHATYKQTADTYSHVLDAFNKDETDKLNK